MTMQHPLDGLSDAERDIIVDLSEGLRVGEIARQRAVGSTAISQLLTRAADRLQIRPGTPTQLVAEALRRGWIE